MKKMLAVVLCFCILLVLCACGSASKGSPAPAESSEPATDSDLAFVKANGKLVIGVSQFTPMDYQDADGSWRGFDADMAKAFAESLGVQAEFAEIDSNSRFLELNNKGIDCIWNGVNLTDEVRAVADCSNAYLINAQVIVVPVEKAGNYTNVEDMADMLFTVTAGSTGESTVRELGFPAKAVATPRDALTEVQAGTAEAAVIDLVTALAMIGEGTDFADLTNTFTLNQEQCVVLVRQGSDLVNALNDFLKAQYNSGATDRIAVTYRLGANVIAQ